MSTLRVLALGSLSLLLAGCYTYVPVTPGAAPASGEPVALDITDNGRVSLAERFGPGLMRVEGRLTNVTPDYSLNVHRVAYITGPATRWSGEQVRIDRALVGSVWQRKLSRGRTALTIGLAALAIGAAFVSIDLIGFFEGTNSQPNEPPGPISNRILPGH
jgi:hypothetical protein